MYPFILMTTLFRFLFVSKLASNHCWSCDAKTWSTKSNESLGCIDDLYVVLEMTCIFPLLECINVSIKFSQQ
jgi:hypothetical protein